ncbi:MAG: tetratricopeptide repeat protein [Alphaproteobacteria bacterium]|nr:tetratricopeptide repeat protein [Alphaproteobacteria bacterium]
MLTSSEAKQTLREIGAAPEGPFELGEAALALAALDRPRVPLDRYRQHLIELCDDVGRESAGAETLADRLSALNTVLVEQQGYEGDQLNYDDLQNANLIRVIDRRKGLPVALGILYIHTARAQGWSISGLAFPGHFLLRLGDGGERLVLDPFHAGLVRAPHDLRDLLKTMSGNDAELRPEHYAEVSDRDILLRLQNNIKLRLIQQKDMEGAEAVVARMLMIAPEQTSLWWEAGVLNVQAGHLQAAIDAIERFIELDERPQARHEAVTLLQQLRDRLN